MAKSLNRWTLIGNLGADPETRYTGSGTAITELRIATTETWTDKQSGDKKEHTEWTKVVFFGRLAEVAGEFLHKGSRVWVEGKARTDNFTDKDGIERWVTKLQGDDLIMLDGKQQGDKPAQRTNTQGSQQRKQQQQQRQQTPPPQQAGFDDDDIPF